MILLPQLPKWMGSGWCAHCTELKYHYWSPCSRNCVLMKLMLPSGELIEALIKGKKLHEQKIIYVIKIAHFPEGSLILPLRDLNGSTQSDRKNLGIGWRNIRSTAAISSLISQSVSLVTSSFNYIYICFWVNCWKHPQVQVTCVALVWRILLNVTKTLLEQEKKINISFNISQDIY